MNTPAYPEVLQTFLQNNLERRPLKCEPCFETNDVLRKSLLPYLPIVGVPIPHREMFLEAKRLEPMAVSHRYKGNLHRGWKSLALHGISSVHTQGAEHYGLNPEDPSIYQWTDIARLCPVTADFFRNTFKYTRYQRVRFMYLEAGGFISPHRDTETYYLGPTNIALNHPEGCRFYMENVGEVPFSPGSINKMALINRHAVINESSETRIHIIVHGSPDWSTWSEIFWQSYQALREAIEARDRTTEEHRAERNRDCP